MPLSAAAATSGAMLAGLSPISNSMRMSLPWAALGAREGLGETGVGDVAPLQRSAAARGGRHDGGRHRRGHDRGRDRDQREDDRGRRGDDHRGRHRRAGLCGGEGATTGVVEPPAGSLRTAWRMSRRISACFRARP